MLDQQSTGRSCVFHSIHDHGKNTQDATASRCKRARISAEIQPCFLHPGYPGIAVLLSLPALDDSGIDFDTALEACGLVAGNRWSDGFFSSVCSGAVRWKDPVYEVHGRRDTPSLCVHALAVVLNRHSEKFESTDSILDSKEIGLNPTAK